MHLSYHIFFQFIQLKKKGMDSYTFIDPFSLFIFFQWPSERYILFNVKLVWTKKPIIIPYHYSLFSSVGDIEENVDGHVYTV